MRLDLWTLIFVTVFVTALLGGLLLFSWWQNRRIEALFWWGGGFLLAAFGSSFLVSREMIPARLSIGVANALLFASYGLLWAGCRSFAGSAIRPAFIWAGSAIWLAFCAVPEFFASFGARVLLSSTIATAYTLACAAEMIRVRHEKLASCRPIVAILIFHAAAMASRPLLLAIFDANSDTTLFTFPWLTAHAAETMIATLLLSFLFLAISKERVEQEQRTMASRDPLTGALNRRAFVERARHRLKADRSGEAVLLLLDIDRFKRINDAHGHGVGDAVLQGFCAAAAEALPAGALFARLGGEEFGCLLTGTSLVDAYFTAEYLRNTVALRPVEAGERSVPVTVSIGMATTVTCGRDLEALMSAADVALYQAKRAGRNRVIYRAIQIAPAAA